MNATNDNTPAPSKHTTVKSLLKELIEVRKQMAALKAEEDQILTALKGQTLKDVEIEGGSVLAGFALGLAAEAAL